jgi:hypothetical protein
MPIVRCPPQDRLLFMLFYVKTNVLQVVQGQVFGMPQNKANQWIHTLLPVLQVALRSQGDAPARSMEHLAERLGLSQVPPLPVEPDPLSQESLSSIGFLGGRRLGHSRTPLSRLAPLFALPSFLPLSVLGRLGCFLGRGDGLRPGFGHQLAYRQGLVFE